ncbi:E3 ubiquitin/ISG15 ligase TRIM25-like [Pyxicephalus adspersus]
MASADLRAELECSICLNIYTDPVTLKCGHSFCRVCIARMLDTQEGDYSCPECRQKFQERPALQSNIRLNNIAKNFPPAEPDQDESGVLCTRCVDSPVPAVISCLLCEVSLCNKHLRVHNKGPEHILCDPTLSLERRKCSIHKKILEYYCTEDETCVCVSCCLIGEHKGHEMESLDEASGKKRNKMRNILQKLLTEREEMKGRVQSLQEHRRRTVLSEISGKAEPVSLSMSDLIQELEVKKGELSRKIHNIEELCNMADPLTVLQESDTGDLCDTEDGDDRERLDKLLHDGGDVDMAGVLHRLSDIIRGVNVYFYIQGAEDISLDVNTADNYLLISEDRKFASWTDIHQNRPDTSQRFWYYSQVLSSQSFSSGRHYWDVDVGGSDEWRVGMCYPSIERRGWQSEIGDNKKSWGLDRSGKQYSVRHDNNRILLPADISSNRVRIYLDYKAGQISFYDLCDPIRPLHTFTAFFTEPLHAGFGVLEGCIKICRGDQM